MADQQAPQLLGVFYQRLLGWVDDKSPFLFPTVLVLILVQFAQAYILSGDYPVSTTPPFEARPAFTWFLWGLLPLQSLLWIVIARWMFFWEAPLPWQKEVGESRSIWERLLPLLILVGGLSVCTLHAFMVAPVFSDDLYRYLWEGKVILSGSNPYVFPPSSPFLEELAASSQAHPYVNNPDISAIYPPLAQYVFVWTVNLFGESVQFIRFIFVVLLYLYFLPFALHWAKGRFPTGRVYSLLLLPLIPIELGVSGHLDILVACGLALYLSQFDRMKKGNPDAILLCALGFAITVVSKIVPLVLVIHAMRNLSGWKTWFSFALTTLFIILTFHIQFWRAGSDLFHALGIYNKVWEHNGFIYPLILDGLSKIDPEGKLWGGLLNIVGKIVGDESFRERVLAVEGFYPQHPNQFGARMMGAVLFGILWLYTLIKGYRFESCWVVLVGLGLLVSPVVHPWYLIVLMPATLVDSRWALPFFWWALTIPFTYAMLPQWWSEEKWEEVSWVWWVQYGGLVAILAWQGWKINGRKD